MPLQETEVLQMLADYGQDIGLVIQLLEERFRIPNAIQQWQSKQLDRTGFLDVARTIYYGVHAAGCTIESEKGKPVSSDLNEMGSYCFDPWKFKRYTESTGIDCDLLDDRHIKALVKPAFYQQ